MGPFAFTLLLLAFVSAALVALEAARRPILARMAARNAWRRPRQTATVVAGLMVGTAIVSAALVAGDSAGYAIRGYVYQSLGHIDESASLEGYPYFPESVYDAFRDDADLQGRFDGMAAHAIWGGSVADPRTDLFEPTTVMVGFEPGRDADFGDFHLKGGGRTDGRDLQRGEAILTAHAAEELDARVGDTVEFRFTPPVDPFLPEITFLNGSLAAAVQPPLVPVPVPAPVPATHPFEVPRGASRLVIAVAWTDGMPLPSPPVLRATDPQGATYADSQPAAGRPMAFLNLSVPPDEVLPNGTWIVEILSELAVGRTYAGVAAALVPVYDLAELRDRAQALDREYGDLVDSLGVLDAFAEPQVREFRVVAVTDGGRGDLFDFRDALFVRLDEAQEVLGRQGEVNLVKFSNRGGVESGVRGTEEAVAALNATLERVKAAHPDVQSVESLEIRPLKKDFLAVADETGQTLTGLLVFAGSLSIITGLLLILNIFTMLAEERRSELGMARAVGLRRGDLVRLFLFEGSFYAVAAAALGAILGLGLAYVMIAVMNTVIAQLSPDLSFPPITFRPSVGAVLTAFSAGALLTFATIVAASRRQSRLNVVRAIRRIEEPDRPGRLGLSLGAGLPVLAAGLGLLFLGWVPGVRDGTWLEDYRLSAQVFGGLLSAVGLGIALRPIVRRRHVAPLMAGLLAAYYVATYFVISEYTNPQETNIVGPIRGVLLTLCVVVLVTHFERGTRLLGRALARMRRLRAVAVPAVSYPLHKKFRTGMTLAMFSVVILSIGFFSIFGALFQTDPERQTGGFDVEGRPALDVEDLAPYDAGLLPAGLVESEVQLRDYETEDPGFITVEGERTGSFGDFYHHVYGYDDAFVEAQDFRLLWRMPGYGSDEEVYRDVLQRDDLIIVSYQYSTNSRNQDLAHQVGDTLEMHLGEETLTYTIAGIQEQYHFPGVFLAKEKVLGLFPSPNALYLYEIAPGEDAEAAAKLIERNYQEVGMDAEASVQEVIREQESFRHILGAMKLFLGLGLIVGVLSLGIVTSRNVLERRQEIGMLRALGFTRRMVRRIFLIEVSFTLLLGALVGLLCAIVVTYGLWFAIIRELNYPYIIPWGEIAVLLGVSWAVALLATWAPIGRSAKVAPAEALRYVE